MRRLLPLSVLILASAFGCASERGIAPRDPLATRLNEIADSSGSDFRVASALYAAAAVVEAGGRVSSASITVDSVPHVFNAVAFHMSYSEAACAQLKNMFADWPSDSTGGFAFDPCQATHTLIAWEGDDIARVVVVQGATGTSTLELQSYTWNFWGEMYDRAGRTQWFMRSGTQSAEKVSEGAVCRAVVLPDRPPASTCRLATSRHSFDLVLGEIPDFVFGDTVVYVDSMIGPQLDTAQTDTGISVDSSYVWEPGPTHTLSMPTTIVDGLSIQITSIEFGLDSARKASSAASVDTKLRRIRKR